MIMGRKEQGEKIMFWRIVAGIRIFINKCKNDNISAYAAQSAFFMILSIIPFLLLFISLIQYTPVTEGMILIMVEKAVPAYVAPFLVSVIHEMYNKSVGLISIAAIAAVWAAAKGIQYLSNGLNAVYDIKETRSYLHLRLRAMLYTLVLLLAIVLALILLVFGNSIQSFVIQYIPIVEKLTTLLMIFRNLIMMVVFIFFFTILFKMLPNRKASLRSQIPGSVLCAVAWLVFSFGLSIYIDYFNGFSMYGSLTAITLLMLWLYFCMYILLICGEINNIYEEYWKMKKNMD